jgi:polysaccharide pyruvyl transferase WcaK-like protein
MKEKYFLLKENYTPEETLCIYKAVDMVMGMRLHSLVMAAVVEKPLVAVSYDPKVNRFMEQLGINKVLDIKDIKYQEVLDLVQNTWENRSEFSHNLKNKMMELTTKALIPVQKVMEILNNK